MLSTSTRMNNVNTAAFPAGGNDKNEGYIVNAND